ncbi:hypothetical protein Glove_266g23 [Diversispora epigaea]|uniref:Uncharacterized protein n=1 Tax=Diversispora epigaea TaxID=1348612 RepID=A0A397I7E4_9GLOM|nr:hypothetical protein Glove_266g23 [Diversispora epigaea]
MLRKIKNTSKWTRFFILITIIQVTLAIILELRLFTRNKNLRKGLSNNCGTFPKRVKRLESENIIFIIFQLFQIWFNIDAVYKQNTIQLIVITILNFFRTVYSIIQFIEISTWCHSHQRTCGNEVCSIAKITSYDLPIVIVLMVFTSIVGFICYNLYLEFGLTIYRKVQGCIMMQIIIAIISVRKEWKTGMYIFLILWLAVILDFVAIFCYSLIIIEDNWYFLFTFILIGIILALLTWAWAILVYFNFDEGLKEILDLQPDDFHDII